MRRSGRSFRWLIRCGQLALCRSLCHLFLALRQGYLFAYPWDNCSLDNCCRFLNFFLLGNQAFCSFDDVFSQPLTKADYKVQNWDVPTRAIALLVQFLSHCQGIVIIFRHLPSTQMLPRNRDAESLCGHQSVPAAMPRLCPFPLSDEYKATASGRLLLHHRPATDSLLQ